MDLKVKDVAELLRQSEEKIRKLASDGELPSYKLNREYRFNRDEVESWITQQKQIYPLKEEPNPRPGMQQFSFYRALNRGGVSNTITGKTKEEIIPRAVELIASQLKLDPEILSEMLLDREKLMPTSINNGIAIPHTRECIQKVPFDLVMLVFLKKPIEYGALDGKPVDTLFFLFASSDKNHLHLLAKIAHLCSDPKGLALLKSQPDKTKTLEFIKDWESKLDII